MGLMMKEKKSVVKETASRYQKAKKKLKGIILNEIVALTGYVRCYASYILRNHGRKAAVNYNTVIIWDASKKHKRQRQKIYDQKVFIALKKIWQIMDYICGKRLAPVLKELIFKLEQHKEIAIDRETREKLLRISPATIDRLLAKERKKQQIKGRSNTKPGTLLKNQIPIRTYSEWDEQRPGFMEIDLVGHDGGDPRGEFIQTLDVTDVCTSWTETQAVRNKAQVWVFEALEGITQRLPFEIKGIDSDNGSEFINGHLFRFCEEKQITFTRSRPYRKNDNCFVEQKNYSVVRRAVGYMRYDTEQELNVLNELYGHLRLYTNFFQPVMKIVEKTRVGSRVKKRYDLARTPYKRALESPYVLEGEKRQLKRLYARLNPAELKRQITGLQNKLLRLVSMKEALKKQKDSFSRGHSDMGWSSKIDYRANGEVEFPALTQRSVLSTDIDFKRGKKVKLFGVDFM